MDYTSYYLDSGIQYHSSTMMMMLHSHCLHAYTASTKLLKLPLNNIIDIIDFLPITDQLIKTKIIILYKIWVLFVELEH